MKKLISIMFCFVFIFVVTYRHTSGGLGDKEMKIECSHVSFQKNGVFLSNVLIKSLAQFDKISYTFIPYQSIVRIDHSPDDPPQ